MQRDWEVVRKILLAVEALPTEAEHPDLAIKDVAAATMVYHLRLLIEAGFVRGRVDAAYACTVSALTWRGHELLDEIRDDQLWDRVKDKAHLQGLNMTVDVLRKALRDELTRM
jgi:hypothetical protein